MIELTTQCPQCRHQFDVGLEQLQQRKGLLRCGQCAHIFDAYECAVPAVATASSSPAPSLFPLRAPYLRTYFIGDVPLGYGVAPEPAPEPEPESSDAIRVYLDTPVTPKTKPKHYYEGQQVKTSSGTFWHLLFGLLLLLIVGQLLYVYRVQVANSAPITRPVLQWLCSQADCDLPYERQIDAIDVRQSALQEIPALSRGSKHSYQLQLQLKNNLNRPQQWPTIVVSFSDAAAAGLATLALTPTMYLAPNQLGLPFEANALQSIRVPVVIQGKKINGFTIEKYYP